MSEIIDTLVSLSLNEERVSVKIFAKELSHIPYNSFIEDIASQGPLGLDIGVGRISI